MACNPISGRQRLLIVAILAALLALGYGFRGLVQGDGPASLEQLKPAPGHEDAGPTAMVWANSPVAQTGQPSAPQAGKPALPRQFIRVDITIEGGGAYRVYFDYQDKLNFHFFDRHGTQAALGLCEAGVEQQLRALKLRNNSPLRLARHGSQIGLFEDGQLAAWAFDDRLIGGAVGCRAYTSPAPGMESLKLTATPAEEIHFNDDFMITENSQSQWRGNGSANLAEEGREHTPQAHNGNSGKSGFFITSLRNPALSASPFKYMGAGENVYSVTGQPWWDNYVYQVALCGPVNQRIGLIFAFQNDKNYGLFRWTARRLGAQASSLPKGGQDARAPSTEAAKMAALPGTDAGTRELVLVQDGQERVLVRQKGGYAPDQWYQAVLRVAYSRVTLEIDGHVLLEAAEPRLVSGLVGVWCDVALPATPALDPKAQAFQFNSLYDLMKQHAVFDNVSVHTLDGVEDDFSVPGPLSGGWLVGTGLWDNVGKPGIDGPAGLLRVIPGPGLAKALLGDRRWAQYEVEADVRPGHGAAGLIFLHRDESNYYSARLEAGALKLLRVSEGRETLVDSAPFEHRGETHLKATIKHGHVLVEARAGSAASLAATEGGLEARAPRTATVEDFVSGGMLRGRAGLLASGEGHAESRASHFSHFRLSFLPEAEPLVTTNAVFEGENSMDDWANPSREWYSPPRQLTINGRPVKLLQHFCQFPGDVELMVEPREFPEPKYELALSVARKGQQLGTGYVVKYQGGGTAEGGSRTASIQIRRQGKVVREKTADDARQLSSLAIRRCGKYIVAVVNGRPVDFYRDEEPLSGGNVAFYTQGVTIRTEAIRITSQHFKNDTFSNAPVDWRTAGAAIAEVTNRWQCDPRWSFFSLGNNLKADPKAGKAAVLWSKRLYPGDVALEFYVGNKMDGNRGKPYTYARDINVTICSDGSDLTKGYTFMFGGQANSGSMILRNGVEVKHSSQKIPTGMEFHRHWFEIRVEKRGSVLSFKVDRYFKEGNTQELSYEDPEPLTGDHVAIWTYNHAIMLSRVRLSGAGGESRDNPDHDFGEVKTPYDTK